MLSILRIVSDYNIISPWPVYAGVNTRERASVSEITVIVIVIIIPARFQCY